VLSSDLQRYKVALLKFDNFWLQFTFIPITHQCRLVKGLFVHFDAGDPSDRTGEINLNKHEQLKEIPPASE
jgi:hypothetical protein